MLKDLWVIIVGLIGGVAVGIQSPIAGAMGQKVGGTASSFIIHLSGMIFSGVFLYLRGGEKIRNWNTLPGICSEQEYLESSFIRPLVSPFQSSVQP